MDERAESPLKGGRVMALAISAGGRGLSELARWAKDCAVWTTENATERQSSSGYRD